jgi:hypothetical protein
LRLGALNSVHRILPQLGDCSEPLGFRRPKEGRAFQSEGSVVAPFSLSITDRLWSRHWAELMNPAEGLPLEVLA